MLKKIPIHARAYKHIRTYIRKYIAIGLVENTPAAEEMQATCRTLKRGKVPGTDGIPKEIKQLVGSIWPDLLIGTYNLCLKISTFPTFWEIRRPLVALSMP